MNTQPARSALLSVSDKNGIVDLARGLITNGIKIYSTGGTAKLLQTEGIAVAEVSEHTGFPEIMQGRVKTLHPKIHGGILARRGVDEQVMKQHGIDAIDIVVVNLYPFAETISQPDATLEAAVENIDIGGPAMIRAAAKNHASVAVLTDPTDYSQLLQQLEKHGGIPGEWCFELAAKAFAHTGMYDAAIANYLAQRLPVDANKEQFEDKLIVVLEKKQNLRYGENPHQKAAFYRDGTAAARNISHALQLHGKEMSYNNIADSDAALQCVKQFDGPACVIVKHANPCGVATADSAFLAYEKAYVCDPVSAFGGIIAFNTAPDALTIEKILERQFVEVLLVPDIDPSALAAVSAKPNVRLLKYADNGAADSGLQRDFKRVEGGVLIQEADAANITTVDMKIVTDQSPDQRTLQDLRFAWGVVKFVKSNAIVFCRDGSTVGIGAGQMSRVYSAIIGGLKAAEAGLEIAGSVMASDAFFPFRDSIDKAAEMGVSAIIQPGGSMRDEEVIAAANEHGIAMAFTSIRHFRH